MLFTLSEIHDWMSVANSINVHIKSSQDLWRTVYCIISSEMRVFVSVSISTKISCNRNCFHHRSTWASYRFFVEFMSVNLSAFFFLLIILLIILLRLKSSNYHLFSLQPFIAATGIYKIEHSCRIESAVNSVCQT